MQTEEQTDFSTDEFPEGSKINASKNLQDDGWVLSWERGLYMLKLLHC